MQTTRFYGQWFKKYHMQKFVRLLLEYPTVNNNRAYESILRLKSIHYFISGLCGRDIRNNAYTASEQIADDPFVQERRGPYWGI